METLDQMHMDVLRDPERFPDHVAMRLRRMEGEFAEKIRIVRERHGGEKKWSASGVLLPLEFDSRSQEHVVILNKRSEDVQQAGDLCLPGGGTDPGKDRLLAGGLFVLAGLPCHRSGPYRRILSCGKAQKEAVFFILAGALRECWEEMRLKPCNVEFLGTLPTQQLQSSPSIIFPIVGRIRGRWRVRPNWEVEKVIRLPLHAFFDPGNYVYYRLNLPADLQRRSGMDCWELPGLAIADEGGEEVLWGVTFRILLNFMEHVLDLSPGGIHPARRIERDLPVHYLKGKARMGRVS